MKREYYHGKTILITGGTGYIGFSLAKQLAREKCDITLLSRHTSLPEKLPECAARIRLVNADIRTDGIWRNMLKNIDTVFYFAGQTSSKYANEHPEQDLEINVAPMVRLLETASTMQHKPDIIFSGTVTQAGLTAKLPVNENFCDAPLTIYDIHKLTVEKYLQWYSTSGKGRAVTIRLPNIYGPGPTSSSLDRGVTNTMIRRALQRSPVTMYGTGNYIRDYLYIEDLVDAFVKAGIHIDKLNGNYYIIGTGKGHTVKHMLSLTVKRVNAKTGHTVPLVQADFPPDTSVIEYRNFVADPKRFKRTTGWTAKTSLQQGIDKTIDHFLSTKK